MTRWVVGYEEKCQEYEGAQVPQVAFGVQDGS